MKKNRQKRPSFLYAVIIFLALVILALGALTLYSLQDLIDLRSKVSGLQTTVQELSDASADLVKQAQELAGLNDQLSNATSDTDTAGASGDTQEEGTIDDQQMQAASLIKLFIMGAVYENFDSLCDTYGADSVNNYLNPMITVSDNDAANTLVNMLGYGNDSAGMDAVNSFCQAHGYTSTSMGRLLLQDNTYGDNYTSVSDCGHFLKEIYQSNAGTTDTTLSHTDAMYSLLKMQERRNKIPANLPEGVKVANKTGELTGVENDAGIIYSTAKGIDLVVCFMSQDLTDSGAAQASIAQDARLIYGYYNE